MNTTTKLIQILEDKYVESIHNMDDNKDGKAGVYACIACEIEEILSKFYNIHIDAIGQMLYTKYNLFKVDEV